MELSFILMQQILKMFIMIFFGYLIVKTKMMKEEEGRSISTVILYIATPCAIINAFQVELNADTLQGVLLSGLAAIIVHIIYLPLANLFTRIFKLSSIEKASVIYSNAGNLIIPLVGSVLGPEWVLYTSGYMIVQIALVWTHCISLVSEEKQFSLKKILSNINIIAIIVGLVLFLTQIRLPGIVDEAVKNVASIMGPLAMFVIGMLIGNMDLKRIFNNKRAYLVVGLRLVVLPLLAVLVLAFSGLSKLHPNAAQIFVVTIMGAGAPIGAVVTQFAQIFDKDAEYASSMNVLSVLFCIITMPALIMLYQILV